jgi:hypothetical protein
MSNLLELFLYWIGAVVVTLRSLLQCVCPWNFIHFKKKNFELFFPRKFRFFFRQKHCFFPKRSVLCGFLVQTRTRRLCAWGWKGGGGDFCTNFCRSHLTFVYQVSQFTLLAAGFNREWNFLIPLKNCVLLGTLQ